MRKDCGRGMTLWLRIEPSSKGAPRKCRTVTGIGRRDSPVQAGDWRSGGRRALNSAQTKRTIFYRPERSPPARTSNPGWRRVGHRPQKKQTRGTRAVARSLFFFFPIFSLLLLLLCSDLPRSDLLRSGALPLLLLLLFLLSSDLPRSELLRSDLI